MTHFGTGPPQQVVHPTPAEERMQARRPRHVKIEDELHAAQVPHDNFAVHKATLQDSMHQRLLAHFHDTTSAMGAALNLGLTPAGMVGKPRDFENAANHPDPSPSDREREAIVAGSQA